MKRLEFPKRIVLLVRSCSLASNSSTIVGTLLGTSSIIVSMEVGLGKG